MIKSAVKIPISTSCSVPCWMSEALLPTDGNADEYQSPVREIYLVHLAGKGVSCKNGRVFFCPAVSCTAFPAQRFLVMSTLAGQGGGSW